VRHHERDLAHSDLSRVDTVPVGAIHPKWSCRKGFRDSRESRPSRVTARARPGWRDPGKGVAPFAVGVGPPEVVLVRRAPFVRADPGPDLIRQ
jgi:hypothetical protein